jgi:hypothetical protein
LLAGGSGGGLGGQERIGDRAELGDLPGRVGVQRGQVSDPPGHPLALLPERIGGYRTGAERVGVQRGAEPGGRQPPRHTIGSYATLPGSATAAKDQLLVPFSAQ